MNPVIEVLSTVLPVILMLGAGVICRRMSLISRDGIGALKNVAVNICLLAWAIGKLINRFLKLPKFLPFLTTGYEAGMLGYALFAILYGSDKISYFACIDLGQVLFVFTLYKMLLGKESDQKTDWGKLFKEMIKSPTIIAIIAGVILGVTGIYEALIPSGISGIIDSCTDFISAPTGGIILIAVGYDLVLDNIPWRSVSLTALSRIFIMVILRVAAMLVVNSFSMDPNLTMALNVMFILPPPYVLPVFADDEEQRNYVSSSLSVITLLTVVGFVVLAAL